MLKENVSTRENLILFRFKNRGFVEATATQRGLNCQINSQLDSACYLTCWSKPVLSFRQFAPQATRHFLANPADP